jgi:hypothetical protein
MVRLIYSPRCELDHDWQAQHPRRPRLLRHSLTEKNPERACWHIPLGVRGGLAEPIPAGRSSLMHAPRGLCLDLDQEPRRDRGRVHSLEMGGAKAAVGLDDNQSKAVKPC